MRAAMPAHLSFDDFIAACQRPLRRSIRVNTLKISVGAFLDAHDYSPAFAHWYLLPMTACIWSCPPGQMLDFPLATLVRK